MGSITQIMGRCQPLLVLRQYGFEQFIPATHGLNHGEFDYEGLGYVNQLIELSKIWKEPRRMELGKYVCDVAPSYSIWRSNRIKDLVLPLVDDMVQSTNLLSERMPIEAEILRSEIDVERKITNQKILRLQEDLGNVIMTEILINEIKKKRTKI